MRPETRELRPALFRPSYRWNPWERVILGIAVAIVGGCVVSAAAAGFLGVLR